jgi:hypothetical protein
MFKNNLSKILFLSIIICLITKKLKYNLIHIYFKFGFVLTVQVFVFNPS